MQADAYFPVTLARLHGPGECHVRQIRGRLVPAGLASHRHIDRHLAHVATGAMDEVAAR